jgi:hypothetical protein
MLRHTPAAGSTRSKAVRKPLIESMVAAGHLDNNHDSTEHEDGAPKLERVEWVDGDVTAFLKT